MNDNKNTAGNADTRPEETTWQDIGQEPEMTIDKKFLKTIIFDKLQTAKHTGDTVGAEIYQIAWDAIAKGTIDATSSEGE